MSIKFEPTPGRLPTVELDNPEGVMKVMLTGEFPDGPWNSTVGEVCLYFRNERVLCEWIENQLPEAQRRFRQTQDPISVVMDALEGGMADDERSYEDIAKDVVKALRKVHGVTLPPDRV